VTGVVLDTGASIALDRADRTMAVLIAEARSTNATLTVPAGCVAQAWRNPSRQARLSSFLRLTNVDVVPIDVGEARRIGLLLSATETSDVVDAHVAICAHRLDRTVFTSDPKDIRRLGPNLKIRKI